MGKIGLDMGLGSEFGQGGTKPKTQIKGKLIIGQCRARATCKDTAGAAKRTSPVPHAALRRPADRQNPQKGTNETRRTAYVVDFSP